jgi:hypothetical protein
LSSKAAIVQQSTPNALVSRNTINAFTVFDNTSLKNNTTVAVKKLDASTTINNTKALTTKYETNLDNLFLTMFLVLLNEF